MNAKKLVTLLLVAVLALSLAACGTENNDKMGDMGGNGSAMTGEPKNAEEALAMHKELHGSRRRRSCRKKPSSGRRCSWRPTRA